MSKSKTALITGANKGIGYEAARQLLEQGYQVFAAARREPEGRKAVRELSKNGGQVSFVLLDVTDPVSIRKAGEEVAKQVDHLDALINNAGIYPDGDKTILDVEQDLLRKAFLTNTAGAVLVAQAMRTLLARSKPGRIVNVSSGLGALGEMGSAAPTYSISKTALNAVTRQLAAALLENGILVNSVCPGWVRTDMGGSNAPRSVEEGASGIVWAATEAPAGFTGNFLRDGKVIPW